MDTLSRRNVVKRPPLMYIATVALSTFMVAFIMKFNFYLQFANISKTAVYGAYLRNWKEESNLTYEQYQESKAYLRNGKVDLNRTYEQDQDYLDNGTCDNTITSQGPRHLSIEERIELKRKGKKGKIHYSSKASVECFIKSRGRLCGDVILRKPKMIRYYTDTDLLYRDNLTKVIQVNL